MSNNNQIHIDAALVHRLITAQFPEWAHFPVKPVEFGGWDNRTFHLGDHMSVKLPSGDEYAPKVEKERYWLPKLAPSLPLPIPTPLAMGKPNEEYPYNWSVYKWINGDTASLERITNLSEFAISLAAFLCTLQKIGLTDTPIRSPENGERGGPLTAYDSETKEAIIVLGNKIDTVTATEIWNEAIASVWQKPPVWVHGDIAVGNLLVEQGKLSAVIDFGGLGIGDPSCDLEIAWTLFTGESRKTFRTAINLDNNTWARGRGWALWKALIVCAGLPGTNPLAVKESWRILDEILNDYKSKR